MAAAGAVIGVISAVISAGAAIHQGRQQKKAAERQADALESQAKVAIKQSEQDAEIKRREVARVREELGRDLVVLTPGIRPAWSLVQGDDQKRVVTPETAVRNGADYIVIGRPIRDAGDPADAAKRVADEIALAL